MSQTRTCFRCNVEKPLTPEHYHREATRALGFAYECKACHRERKKGRDRRPERFKNLDAEGREKHRARQRRWYAKGGRVYFLHRAYMRLDADRGLGNDLDMDFLRDHIMNRPCYYCGGEGPIGCDRIDNNKGHTRDNVVPACGLCNIVRGDNFTSDEMKVLGKTIAAVLAARHG